ncbi:mercury resistance system periplasmic binding protein MerP [Hydrocarboniclastica marina]|uniref:Periplasmic mercury ion-binding protein n=1 Tax=Hydrocarboniclastica marina TaxID=2259620 RepID=A0A4P7XID3_9ALTE|nr:mercury resistance system periplasmic binding protein MerP [Hydrocarboniclastica marina]QCF26485.1 mercury resistance system periplasmic binding protein MerP [Hydrocarboniclastica marina]
MKIRIWASTFILTVAGMGSAFAAQQTVTLAVDNMTCSTCTYTVKKALNQVSGIESVSVSYETKTATVTFEDTEASVTDLTAATKNAGYPSRRVSERTQ